MNRKNNPNAKNPDWEVPLTIPGVDPADYAKSIESANGSAAAQPIKPKQEKQP